MTPRWFQIAAVDALRDYFDRSNGNPIIALPPGAGKSFTIAMCCQAVIQAWPDFRIIVGTHVKELIRQNHKALLNAWNFAPAGIYSAGLKSRETWAPITFAGIASIYKVIEEFDKVDWLIIDECHLLGPNSDGMYMQVVLALRAVNPKIKVIGFTATPYRTGMGLLTNGEIFTDIIYDMCNIQGYKRLFQEGFLVPPRAKRTDTIIDTSGIAINNGEFSKAGLAQTATEEMTWAALNESLNKNPDRKCRLVFCAGISHAMLANDMLRYIGLRSEVVHSKMASSERDAIMQAFINGELDSLCNNGIVTTGIDNPRIDHIIGLRATMSVGLNVQMIGRGTRPYEELGYVKEDCIVSDHAGNVRRLGPVDDPYIPKMRGKAPGNAPVKICPACDTYNHARAVVCEYCGEPFQIRVGFKANAYEDVIVRSDLPIIETIKVQHVYYTQHLRRDATPETKPVLKAVYQCGLQKFQEFIALEGMGIASKKARDWWKQRFSTGDYVPTTVSEAMQLVDKLIPPNAIKVWVNKKYPEVTGYEF